MAKNEKTPIVVDGVEYFYEDVSQQAQTIVNHIADLDRKIGSTQFNLDQLIVGRNAFAELLKTEVTNMENTTEVKPSE